MRDELKKRVKQIFAKPMTNRDFLEASFCGFAAAMIDASDKSPEEVNEMALRMLDPFFTSLAMNAPNEEIMMRWAQKIEDWEKMRAQYEVAYAASKRGETSIRLDN